VFNTVDLHGIRADREARLHGNRVGIWEAAKEWERERHLTRMSDATIVVSRDEAELLQTEVPGARIFTLSLPRDVIGASAPFAKRAGIGFIGGFAHAPNVDALKYFVEHIWPEIHQADPSIDFSVVGPALPEDIHGRLPPGATYLGHVPDVTSWFESLRLTVAPLRYGAGAKGKVASSLAHGVPCVATGIAAEGMGLVFGRDVVVADAPSVFARQVLDVYRDETRWHELSAAGTAFAETHFSRSAGKKTLAEVLAAIFPKGEAPLQLRERLADTLR
jgi:glycosyltransferase involved in cell wall biosynthesis